MRWRPSVIPFPRGLRWGICLVAAALSLSACAEGPPPSRLPPSASDLPLLKTIKLCDRKPAVLARLQGERHPWGAGEEVRISRTAAESGAEESLFFDQDGLLVGALFVFPGGLKLDRYPVLRDTLSKLPTSTEFYVNVAGLASQRDFTSSRLLRTGDERSTTEYLVLGEAEAPTLLMASLSVDPYVALLSVHRRDFLARIEAPAKGGQGARKGPGVEDKEPFGALQQFARGETAQLGYCGARNHALAVEAYGQALAQGLSNPAQVAEAHHKLGLAWMGKGRLDRARDELIHALQIQPNRADVINNLGEVYRRLGDPSKAIAAFERAVTLKPNYALARFNLAEMYETLNPKQALSEYETYLAIVEGIPEEEERAKQARARIEALKR
ncbi:tetratricopeptide repeat protein [Nitrospira sp. Kam-Ns4a]